MIKYSGNTINDWNYGASNLIKVYRNGAVCYYKVTGGGDVPTAQTPCYAVVDDISQYSDTEFEDVFNKADGKWYKLNNLNQYEEYGVYASGRTSCEGSTSRLPQGYTEVEYIENTSRAYINLGVDPYSANGNSFTVECTISSYTQSGFAYLLSTESSSSPYNGFTFRYDSGVLTFGGASYDGSNADTTAQNTLNTDGTSAVTLNSDATRTRNNNVPLTIFCGMNGSSPWRNGKGRVYYLKMTLNNSVARELIPAQRDSDSKYGMYDIVNDVFYVSPNNVNFSGGEPITPTDCVTTYEGKLTLDSDSTPSATTYEYIYSGDSWNNLGEVSGGSRLPQGYTEVEYITSENISTSVSGPYIDTNFTPNQNTRVVMDYQPIVNSQRNRRIFGSGEYDTIGYVFNMENQIGLSNCYYYYKFGDTSSWYTTSVNPDLNRHTVDFNNNGEILLDNTSIATLPNNTFTCTYHLGLFRSIYNDWTTYAINFLGRVYSCKVYDNGTLVRDLVPCINPNNAVGMYDVVNDVFYTTANASYQFTAGSVITGQTIYPMYYDEKSDPPNNLVFSSMTEAESYECPWVGMRATINGVSYVFSGDSISGYEWVEQQHSLPDVPFSVNFNAKNYNSSTKTLLKTSGQLVDVDAVITAGTPTVGNGYLTIASGTRATIEGYQSYFNRDSNNPNLTIISKQNTNGRNCHMFANRDTNYNWMYRCYNTKLTLHGSSEQGNVGVTTQPVIESVRVDSNRLATYNNYTDNTSSTYSNFAYGSTNNGKFALFQGNGTTTGENFVGDFYWVYMTQNTLTDEQIQQVIDYNENL